MFETYRAGHEARTDADVPPAQKFDGLTLGRGETHIPADDCVILTDGGRVPGHSPTPVAPDPQIRANGGESQRFVELPDFQRDILLTLARSQPTHGQGLRDDLGALRDEDVNDGRLYPNLNTLVDLGLVEKRENVHDDRSHEYVLTPAGRTSVRQHAQRVTGAADALDQEVA